MRHARAHELQINGSAVYSFTVTRLKLVLVRLHGGVIYIELWHRIGKEQKAHSFDLFDAAATRRNARAPTAAMLLARSSQPDQ